MALSQKARDTLAELADLKSGAGPVKALAKRIKRDHPLALELWETGDQRARELAVLIMDAKELTQPVLDRLAEDIAAVPEYSQRITLSDWLMANQLRKNRRTTALLESWQDHPSPVLRRLFWYHQARLRWTGQTPPDNTPDLLDALERDLAGEAPDVQWAMNLTAGWIGVHDPAHRARCVALGERLGLYRDDPVSRGCTPNYLPEFIRIEAAKREA